MSVLKKTGEAESEIKTTGVEIRAGDRPYMPAGAFQIWIEKDGTVGLAASLAVDPWLPDLSTDGGTPVGVMDNITRQGFPVSSICGNKIYACQKSREVMDLLAQPEIARLNHIAVVHGTQAVGVLDLDKARGQVRHNDPVQSLLVAEIYEPLCADHCLRGDSPLIDYILTADERPFRLVQLIGNKLGTINVEDLQKLPVRVLLFMQFVHLESLLVRQLCVRQPQYLDIVRTDRGINLGPLGNTGQGPVRRIEDYKFPKLLQKAKAEGIITIESKEIPFLARYRNNLAHGPRWYITRRAEVVSLVNCTKKVSELIQEAVADSRESSTADA